MTDTKRPKASEHEQVKERMERIRKLNLAAQAMEAAGAWSMARWFREILRKEIEA